LIAAPLATAGLGFAQRQLDEFSQDPIVYFIQVARKVGLISLIAGVIMGTLGYYLKASATAAGNNAVAVLGNIGTIFSNIKAPTFQPSATGTAPLSFSLQGIQNFFGDAWKTAQAAGSDIAQIGGAMGTLAEDVAQGLIDIAKAILAFVMHFPTLLWDGVVLGIGGAAADVLNWAFPWFIILGGGLLIASLVAQGIRALWKPTVGAAWSEAYGSWTDRRRLAIKARFDRIFKNPPKMVPEPILTVPPPQNVAGNGPSSPPAAPVDVPEPPAAPALEAPAAPPAPVEKVVIPEPPNVQVTVEAPPGQLTQAELEKALGEAFDQVQQEQRAQRRAAQRAEPPPKHPPSLQEILAEPLAA
jgi:hypothetical protein